MKSSVVAVFSIASFLIALCAPASAQVQANGSYLERLKRAEAALSALPADAYGQSRSPETDKAILAASSALQQLGTMRSFVGDTDGAMAAFDLLTRIRRPPHPAAAQMKLAEDAVAEDAIKAIVAEARNKRVVLLNEAHHVPMHRAFSQKLAAELRKIGYTYLACETFGAGDAPVAPRGYVDAGTGYYTQEPVFAGFVNSAMADRWKLVAYEFQGASNATGWERQQQRETGQARNLVDRIFARDKDAKVFIHVGYGHHQKSPDPDAKQLMMGEVLRRLTQLDTLHISQHEFHAHPDRADETPVYQQLLDKFRFAAPFVLKKDGRPLVLLNQAGRVDMQVIFPRYDTHDGRPDWLASLAGRQPRAIPPALLPASGRRLVLAYREGDEPGAVPADIVMVEAGKPVPKLMLPKGEFRFVVED